MRDPLEERLDRSLDLLRARGGRATTARRAVLRALLTSAEHVSAEQLAATVQERHPDVHLSTVYRALEAFEELGVLTHVHLGHGRAIYHLTDRIHHHAVCEACRKVFHLPDDLFSDVRDRLEHDLGFEVDAHHFALVGRCAECRPTGTPTPPQVPGGGGPASVSVPPR